MDMIRHHHERIQLNVGDMIRQVIPGEFHQPAKMIQMHFLTADPAKQALAVRGAKGDEIRPGQGVVIPLQA